jgi:hypothetical protein
MKNIIPVALMLIFSLSCEKNTDSPKKPDFSVETVYLDPMYFGRCFVGLYPPNANEIIIKNNSDYIALGDSCRALYLSSIMCDTANLPAIDFNKYSLIGKLSEGGGCGVEYIRDVTIDTITKTYNYSIEAEYNGTCEMLIMNMNWALVPSIPDDYKVFFNLQQNQN